MDTNRYPQNHLQKRTSNNVTRPVKLTKKAVRNKPHLRGSVVILDDLETASKELAKEFEQATERSAANLRASNM